MKNIATNLSDTAQLMTLSGLPEPELFVKTDCMDGYDTDDGGCLLWSFGRRDDSDVALFTATQLHAYAQQYAAAMNVELQARVAELESYNLAMVDGYTAELTKMQARIAELEANDALMMKRIIALNAECETKQMRIEGLEMACNIAKGLKDIRHG